MALEDLTGTKYIDSLDSANPLDTDVRSDGDGHLRGIKNILKTTFAAITGAVTASHTDLNKTSQLPAITAGDIAKVLRVNAGGTAWNLAVDSPNRNYIINGGFDIYQRGTTHTSIADNAYSADRWQYQLNGLTCVHDTNQGVNTKTAQAGVELTNYYNLVPTTADASVGAGDFAFTMQVIEGSLIRELKIGSVSAKEVTLSFWHAHTLTGTYCVSLRNNAGTRSYVAEYTQSVTDTWEKSTITLTLDTDTSADWPTNASGSLTLSFIHDAGTTFQTTPDSWQAGNYLATSNQVNMSASTSNYFRLTDVKLEEGAEVTPFVKAGRNFAGEKALCQRYYETSYSVGYKAGDVTELGREYIFLSGIASAGHTAGKKVDFTVQKRASPTITMYSTVTGTAGYIRDGTAGADATVTTLYQSTGGFLWYSAGGGASTIVNYFGHWVAEAEI